MWHRKHSSCLLGFSQKLKKLEFMFRQCEKFFQIICSKIFQNHDIFHSNVLLSPHLPAPHPPLHQVPPLEFENRREASGEPELHVVQRLQNDMRREIENSFVATCCYCSLVVGQSSILGSVEGSQPNPRPVPRRVSYLRRVVARSPLSNPSVGNLVLGWCFMKHFQGPIFVRGKKRLVMM